ncbi:MarR family winged helix-turn-helix transcriptional regulator [Pseudooceanicola sp. LIPI14-2-Ac024]|uniref:MarR family winged helix-turn-helix transcriptional regulator n=1 Tax=Pseudooceanicola sp. LIPI14-2-Ac024 TaxID=3344875 RepID=UPI0035CFE661
MCAEEIETTEAVEELLTGSCYCLALRRASRRLIRRYDAVLAEHGLTIAQFSLLPWIHVMKRPTVQRLADKTEMDQSTLSRGLALLERDGLVTSDVDPEDRRQRILRLTEEGARRMVAASEAWKAAQDEVARDMGAEDILSLMQGVDRLGR